MLNTHQREYKPESSVLDHLLVAVVVIAMAGIVFVVVHLSCAVIVTVHNIVK